ncbi:MAG TPA: tetratricopeptide repeat protein [Verrucomicrobiae bacterium]|nr:tetratricopeptide repeat protein [Verrucomicrobiae bacterium]
MFPEFLRPLVAPAAVVLCAAAGFAQPDLISWKGELRSDSPGLFAGYTVKLYDLHHLRAGSANVGLDGRFEFGQITDGDYYLEVSDSAGREVYQNLVHVSNNGGTGEIQLPNETTARPPSGPVSVAQLLHPPSAKAIAHARAAQKLSEAGQYERAAAELETAVRISPDFADARTNLGAQYLRLGRYADALDQLQRATEVQPSLPALTDLACAQLLLGRPADAAATARRVLRLDADNPPAQYFLGMALAESGSTAEAIPHLEKAAETMPSVRMDLERLRAR